MKHNLLYIASFLLLLSCSFNFQKDGNGFELNWLWEGKIQVPIVLISTAIICIGLYFYFKFRTTRK